MKMKRMIALISLIVALALVNGLFSIRVALGQHESPPDLREYYPLFDGNTWTYQVKSYRADGQIFYRLRTQTVSGEVKLNEKVSAKKLMDDEGGITWFQWMIAACGFTARTRAEEK